jgi:hypothetical protein
VELVLIEMWEVVGVVEETLVVAVAYEEQMNHKPALIQLAYTPRDRQILAMMATAYGHSPYNVRHVVSLVLE